MTYYFYHDDPLYKETFQSYYLKNMSHKLQISFEERAKVGEVVICDKSVADKFSEHECLWLSNRNVVGKSEINMYQEMKMFYDFLLKYDVNEIKSNEIEVFAVSNISGGSGATTLSLNLANLLSECYQVFYISLDIIASYENLLSQDQKYGFSEIIYKLKTETELEWLPEETLEYFNVCDYIEDMMCFQPDMLIVLVEKLKALNYERIVIDIGQRYQYLCLDNYRHFMVIDEKLKNINQLSKLNSNLVVCQDKFLNGLYTY